MALTAAEKQRLYRERKRQEAAVVGPVAEAAPVVARPARDVRMETALVISEALFKIVDDGLVARTVQPSVRRAYFERYQELRRLLGGGE